MNPLVLLGLLAGGIWLFQRNEKQEADADSIIVFDVYPANAAVEKAPVPKSIYGVAHNVDCSLISVAHGWWEGVARPFAKKTKISDPSNVALALVIEALPTCGNIDPTDAVNEFLDDVTKAVKAWRSGGSQTSTMKALPSSTSTE